ncbi:FixH family protein [Neisseriaceae bacterium B1]
MNEHKQPETNEPIAPWYKHRWPWILMLGPIIVVFAAFYTYYIAAQTADDMVSDDYYKEGKHINLQLERDVEAVKRHINAQVLFNDDGTAAKVFIGGDFDKAKPVQLSLIHPAKKANDQTVMLKAANTPLSGDKVEYSAVFKTLPPAVHWYVRVEDTEGKWRVEEKWLPKQGASVDLKPKHNVLVEGEVKAASAAAASVAH